MEINVQSVIDKLASNYANDIAEQQKSRVILEVQVEALQAENQQLERRVSELTAENDALKDRMSAQSEPVEGELVG